MSTSSILNQPPVDREHAHFLLKEMLRIRRFEEKSAEKYSLQKIHGFLHLYIGEEATGVGAMQAFSSDDAIVATYREHGQALARGIPSKVLMAEMFGKATGCSHGHGGSMHFFDARRRFYGGYAIVGGGLPIAVGLALADKLLNRNRVTACFFGDGAVAEGEFHESLNLAALWKLPIVFLCENNLYAMGTALERHQAQTDVSRKAASYNLPSGVVDGMDVVAVETASRQAANSVRNGNGPILWNSVLIVSALIPCLIRICIARRRKLSNGRSAIRSRSSRLNYEDGICWVMRILLDWKLKSMLRLRKRYASRRRVHSKQSSSS